MDERLNEALRCYDAALKLDQAPEVLAQTTYALELLTSVADVDADPLRLAVLDLALQTQLATSYLPPPAATVAHFSELAARANLPIYQARALHYHGLSAWTAESFEQGLKQVKHAMEALLTCGDLQGQCYAVSSLGLFMSVMGQLEGGVAFMRDSLILYEQLETEQRDLPLTRLNRARLMMRLALNLFDLDYFDEALHWLGEARAIYEQTGRLFGCTTEYAQLYARVGDWAEAERWAQMGMQHGSTESDRAYAQTIYGFILGQQNRTAEGITQLEQSLATVTRLGLERWQCALASVYLADLLLTESATYDPVRAEALSNAGLALGEAAAVHYGSIYGLLNKARLALNNHQSEAAVRYAVDAADRVRARDTLTLVREEEALYWEYAALRAAGRDGLPSLAAAHQRLQIAAERISDPAMRHSFLQNVPLHRLIETTYDAYAFA